MDGTVKKCLMRWHEYSDSVTDALQSLRHQEELLDVTLACEGKTVRAHKLVLAAGSQYFRRVFKEYPCEHPTIILDGISWKDLLNILQFMYCGLVFVDEKSACSLLNAAYTLDVVGLNYVTEALLENKTNATSEEYKQRPKVITKIKYKSDLSNYENSFSSDALKSSVCNNSNISISNIGSNKLQRSRGCDEATREVCNGFLYNRVEENKLCKEIPARSRSEDEDETPSQKSSREEKSESMDDILYRIGKMSSLVNGESGSPSLDTVSKSYEDFHSLDNETIHDEGSLDNGDADMGPAPLPLNHPAILASSKSALAAVSAAAAALAAAASNGGTVTNMNYAAYLAANSRSMMNNSSGGAGSHSPLHNTPSPTGMSFSSWMTQSNYNNNNASPSPSPPPFSGGLPPGFIHPPGMSQQDLQATLEQYQRKLAFHEPRPCPTCRRISLL
ncbi:Broad-complex core protein [Armadillidium nasatum]|uniref:Broad-complex core protein n=1 Tax=Armadillidium nasatum TaxID=96803 RepID=A0A5N5T4V3_9CRUS|nr:Broad-complex core protein [Armadillidium nasatum]